MYISVVVLHAGPTLGISAFVSAAGGQTSYKEVKVSIFDLQFALFLYLDDEWQCLSDSHQIVLEQNTNSTAVICVSLFTTELIDALVSEVEVHL